MSFEELREELNGIESRVKAISPYSLYASEDSFDQTNAAIVELQNSLLDLAKVVRSLVEKK